MASFANDGGVGGLTQRWADMVLEDEVESFEPVLDGVDDNPVEGEPTWVIMGRFLTSKLVKVEYMLDEGPWSFENNMLVCRQLVDGALPGSVVLDSVDMWVQVHDLPLGYMSESLLEQVGNYLGAFVRTDDKFVGAP